MEINPLLLQIKDDIRAIEDGDTRAPLLDEVKRDYLEMMELLKLFLISERDSYYGYFLMNMQFAVNFSSNSIAGIKLNTFPPVLEANPLLLCKFKLKEILYIICHEIDHVVLNHPAEMVKANPEQDPDTFYRFNLAADAAVNDRINHEISAEKHGFLSQPDGLVTSTVLSKMYKLGFVQPMQHYAYYFALIRDKSSASGLPSSGGGNQKPESTQDSEPQNGQDSMMQKKMQKESSDSAGQQPAEDKQDSQSQNGQNSMAQKKIETSDGGDQTSDAGDRTSGDGDQIVTAKNCGHLEDHNWEAGNDAEDAEAAVKEFVNAAVGMMSSESRGLMPGHFMSEVEKLNKPPQLSWQQILKKYVGTITANKRKTRTRLNRRQPERFDLSGAMDDKTLKIAVAIDTSGSVSNEMIAQIFNEIFAILAKRKFEITVIECDTRVNRVYRVKLPADVQRKVTGRGGTSFSPVIEYVNNDKYYRDALLIYFTDGFGEREIPRPQTYRNLWVVFGNEKNLSLKEPYGAVLKL